MKNKLYLEPLGENGLPLHNIANIDNCMGSGTTGLACQRLNRQFIGIEKEKAYYDISVKRLSETLF